jgi:hypothetical protein
MTLGNKISNWDTGHVMTEIPARGAYKSLGHTQVWSLLLMFPERKCPTALSSGFEKRFEIFYCERQRNK